MTSTPSRRAGYSLVEVMVAMTLLTVIVVGLLASLNQTQRALRISGSQTDTMENGRAFMSMISQELAELARLPAAASNTFRFYSVARTDPIYQNIEGLGADSRTNQLYSFGFVVRDKTANQWRTITYDFERADLDFTMGALYRTETNFPYWALTNDAQGLTGYQKQLRTFGYDAQRTPDQTNFFGRMIEGVVHLAFKAYDQNGLLIPEWSRDRFAGYWFTNAPLNLSTTAPSAIEIELGVLDPDVRRRVKGMPDPNTVQNYLKDRAGNIQVFRQRIPISVGP
ncbi:MAG: prepilin-type N-terminal cleavage/methylation domain-containing protein [Verrucomicrobia bacterium]|nr:prepilin-type N-terminal cleavage/methylation domain-containing protein [Verrucomicrobiota bacterium]MBI3869957.1 prepilin-type N-terminal cleavage/methylation domain-containing protein [Verrucomicrobiota bacterium]